MNNIIKGNKMLHPLVKPSKYILTVPLLLAPSCLLGIIPELRYFISHSGSGNQTESVLHIIITSAMLAVRTLQHHNTLLHMFSMSWLAIQTISLTVSFQNTFPQHP